MTSPPWMRGGAALALAAGLFRDVPAQPPPAFGDGPPPPAPAPAVSATPAGPRPVPGSYPGTKVVPLLRGPAAYFQSHCARCHGYRGMMSGPQYGKAKDDMQLREQLRRMASVNALAPIEGDDLEGQFAFHRSLHHREPFLSWILARPVDPDADPTPSPSATPLDAPHGGGSPVAVVRELIGEVSPPDAKVSARLGGKTIPVEVEEGIWTVRVPADASLGDLEIEAIGGRTLPSNARALLKIAHAAWSHGVAPAGGAPLARPTPIPGPDAPPPGFEFREPRPLPAPRLLPGQTLPPEPAASAAPASISPH